MDKVRGRAVMHDGSGLSTLQCNSTSPERASSPPKHKCSLSMLLNLSVPQFPHLQKSGSNSYHFVKPTDFWLEQLIKELNFPALGKTWVGQAQIRASTIDCRGLEAERAKRT